MYYYMYHFPPSFSWILSHSLERSPLPKIKRNSSVFFQVIFLGFRWLHQTLTFNSATFEFISVCAMKNGSNCVFFHMVIQLAQYLIDQKVHFFPHWFEMLPFSCTAFPSALDLFPDFLFCYIGQSIYSHQTGLLVEAVTVF